LLTARKLVHSELRDVENSLRGVLRAVRNWWAGHPAYEMIVFETRKIVRSDAQARLLTADRGAHLCQGDRRSEAVHVDQATQGLPAIEELGNADRLAPPTGDEHARHDQSESARPRYFGLS
jgi:hypothetical protein